MTYESYRDALLAVALEKGCEAAEVYAREAQEFSVEVMEQQIDSYSVSRSMGLSVRVSLEGKNGYAYTELFEDPEGLVEKAMDNARASETEDVHPMQGAADYPTVALPENPLEGLSDAERIDLAMKLEKLALAADPRCVRVADNQVAFVKGKTHIANTLGLNASRDASIALCYTVPVLQEGEQMQDGLSSAAVLRSLIWKAAPKRLLRMLPASSALPLSPRASIRWYWKSTPPPICCGALSPCFPARPPRRVCLCWGTRWGSPLPPIA